MAEGQSLGWEEAHYHGSERRCIVYWLAVLRIFRFARVLDQHNYEPGHANDPKREKNLLPLGKFS